MNDFDFVRRNSHPHMFLPLGFADRHPAKDFFKQGEAANAVGDQSHPSALEMAVAPARGLKRRPKIAREAALAGLTMVQEKTIDAGEAIIVEIMNHGDVPFQGQLVNDRGHGRKNVMNLPDIIVVASLQLL